MIDLIIPFYNNGSGLIKTLDSVNTNVFHVTIVDDGSFYYLPPNINAAQVFRYNQNRGPGFARQFGLERTHEPYVMFLDTGDVFISKEVQYRIEYELVNTKAVLASYLYYHYDELSKHTDNRLHGKIYKRTFLEEYGISFPLESSYLNEDVGFNRACKLIIENKKLLQTRTDLPVIRQVKDENSLTQKDNQVVLYRDQTRALSLVSIHTIDTLIKNNINPQEEINQIAISLYYWFVRTAAERPQYIQDAWSGAKIFYDAFKNEIIPNNLLLGNPKIKQCLSYRNKINFPINILRFAHDIQQYEEIPKNYLGGNCYERI
jgi:glycosyltransferase involved in cell wall biosynthesis